MQSSKTYLRACFLSIIAISFFTPRPVLARPATLVPPNTYLNFETSNASARVAYPFPENFLFGTASAAFQIEGHNTHSDWAAWEKLGKNEDAQMVGAGTDHWNRMSEDVELLKKLGMRSYRFSIEWSRLETEPGVWDANAIEQYRSFVDKLEAAGISPMITLVHFTLPNWLARKGGFRETNFVKRFGDFTQVVSKKIAPHATHFITFNEPMVHLLGGYVDGSFPPGLKNDFKAFFQAEIQMIKAHAYAYKILKSSGSKNRKVGIAQSLVNFKPKTPILDSWLSSAAQKFFNRSLLDALYSGELKQSIPTKGRIHYDLSRWQEASFGQRVPAAPFTPLLDFIGMNTYSTSYLRARWFEKGILDVERVGKTDKKFSHGGDLDPRAIYEVLQWISHSYPNMDIHITESGYNGSSDAMRRAYILEVLAYCSRAISEGVRLKGYQYWSFIDSFEWLKGWKAKDAFGLVAFDRKNFTRTPKPSAILYRTIIQGNGFVSLPLKEAK